MPKIIYRPNTTPPPFVPPTPPEPTSISLSGYPARATGGENVYLKFNTPINFDFTAMEINIPYQTTLYGGPNDYSTEVFKTFSNESDCYIPFEGKITFYLENGETKVIPCVADLANP